MPRIKRIHTPLDRGHGDAVRLRDVREGRRGEARPALGDSGGSRHAMTGNSQRVLLGVSPGNALFTSPFCVNPTPTIRPTIRDGSVLQTHAARGITMH